MYRLPLADASFDVAVLQMVLHYAEDPAGAVAEAARALRSGGRLIIIDLARHGREEMASKRAHRWPGFPDAVVNRLLTDAGLDPVEAVTVPGPLDVRLWCAVRRVRAVAPPSLENEASFEHPAALEQAV